MSAWLLAEGTVPAGLPVVKSMHLVLPWNPHVSWLRPEGFHARATNSYRNGGLASRTTAPSLSLATSSPYLTTFSRSAVLTEA